MPIEFKIDQRLAGYATATVHAGEHVPIRYRELIGPEDAVHLSRQLENLQGTLFGRIPGLPDPARIGHLLVIIRSDLKCTAYVDELRTKAQIQTSRSLNAGDPVYVSDLQGVQSVELGVDVPTDCGFVFVRSMGWKRSLFFDFGPLVDDVGPRDYPLEQALAQQLLLLVGLPSSISTEPSSPPPGTRLQRMEIGLAELRQLLADECTCESSYQELLEQHPWMLMGGIYSEVRRHAPFNDQNIPDFTARRSYDGFHDIVELKQPFLPLFRSDGGFTSAFNDAWNQAERYLAFTNRNATYLRDEKELNFDCPRCVLLLGSGLTERQMRQIRSKENFNRAFVVLTYDHVVETGTHLVKLMRTAGERTLSAVSCREDSNLVWAAKEQ